jgi:ParB-like chromosome segregation protein Spo0J
MNDTYPETVALVGFEPEAIIAPIASIVPLKVFDPAIKLTEKYKQIVASVRVFGLIESPVVSRDSDEPTRFYLLDGLVRIEVLKDLGHDSVECLVSTDDETYSYNKRINRLSTVQEHRMIVRAMERGVPEARIAEALNLEVASVKRRFRLLDGICEQAAALLADKPCPMRVFETMKAMGPLRQIEAAELMIGQGNYNSTFAKAILAATPDNARARKRPGRRPSEVTQDQISRLEQELSVVQGRVKSVEESYGIDNLHLTVAKTYLSSLLAKPKIVQWLERHHADYLTEFKAITQISTLSDARDAIEADPL